METSQDEDEFIEIEQPFLDRNLRRVMHQRKRSASPSSVDDEDEDEHNGEPDEEVAEQDEAMRLDPPFPDADPTPQRRPPFLVRSTRSRLCRRAKQTRQRRRKGARRAAAEATSWYTHIRQQPEAEYPKTMTTKKLDTRCFQCPLCSRFSSSSVEVSFPFGSYYLLSNLVAARDPSISQRNPICYNMSVFIARSRRAMVALRVDSRHPIWLQSGGN